MTGLIALQEEVLRLLRAANVAGGRVYDHVPEALQYPYVVLGEKTEDMRAMFGRDGVRDTITLHIWSAHSGDKEAMHVLAEVSSALDDQVIDMGDYGPGRLRREFVTTIREEGRRHIPVRYRVAALWSPAA